MFCGVASLWALWHALGTEYELNQLGLRPEYADARNAILHSRYACSAVVVLLQLANGWILAPYFYARHHGSALAETGRTPKGFVVALVVSLVFTSVVGFITLAAFAGLTAR